MTRVDAKGRIVLPQEIRNRLGIEPGTAVEVREEDGRAIVEPEEKPEEIVEDLEAMIADAAAHREQTPSDELDARSRDHLETVRRGAERTSER